VKTSELTGTALDWAVAKCEGHTVKTYRNWLETENDYWKGRDCYFAQNHPVIVFPGGVKAALVPAYSTDFTQAGPIIESERIDVFSITYGSGWCAGIQWVRPNTTSRSHALLRGQQARR
jgi:hypothetical protein